MWTTALAATFCTLAPLLSTVRTFGKDMLGEPARLLEVRDQVRTLGRLPVLPAVLGSRICRKLQPRPAVLPCILERAHSYCKQVPALLHV